MTTQDIRQCWALNKNLQRCDMPAGHPGDHAIQTTWTDRDCYDPSGAIPTPTTNPGSATIPGTPGPSMTDTSPALEKRSTRCVACSHAHKAGPCNCGCYEFVG